MSEPNQAVLALLKLLETWNAIRPTVDEAIANEEARTGMTRDELHAFSKRLKSETDTITQEDMGDS